jgi:hypothetical protein
MDPDAIPMQALRAWRIHDGEATELSLQVVSEPGR